jgi:RHH-type proline utilization regulon transcriptional repressor/proline dehydrogenase/delta 1-pyrroline-5-carboxylate dehydrogenase
MESSAAALRSPEAIAKLLAGFRPHPATASLPVEVQQTLHLARVLCQRAQELQTSHERRQQAELDRMIQSPHDKATLMNLTDQAFRARRAARAADQLIHILDVQGVPRFFGVVDRTLLRGFQSFGAYLPGVAMPFVKERMQHETANVVLPAEDELLTAHLRARWEEGVRMNVNFLGEALLGEDEAQRRLQGYMAALVRPEIEVISVKVSTLYSQISPLARRHAVDVLCDRLELLFRAAAKSRFTRLGGDVVPKLVYLDMEEYRDKEITAEAFMQALDRPGLEQARGGIALQAYLPDSSPTHERVTDWARRRVAAGGAPVTVRLVKGANLEAERVEASIRGWPQAPYKSKLETDANYLRMLHHALVPENLQAVHLGVASHNLFTVSSGLVLAAKAGVLDRVQFEMLEGMANHQRRALVELAGNVLLYAPACRQEDFTNAIGYLVRRMDENSGPENFLRYAFNLEVDSPAWHMLEQQFLDACQAAGHASIEPRRTQDRRCKDGAATTAPTAGEHAASAAGSVAPALRNEPDTDWSLPQNCAWAESIIESWMGKCGPHAPDVPLVIAGEEVAGAADLHQSHDPSRPGVVVGRYRQASEADADRAIAAARADASQWRTRPEHERVEILHRVAGEIAAARGDLMGAMLAEGGKTLAESDPEVSEAIDFCRFYADSARYFTARPGLAARGRGVAVVVSPWNFPLAIPCGGVAAALAAGNTVILKPASDTVLVAYELCRCFWRAGVPRDALQFAPASGGTVGQRLVTHSGVDVVILTGGTATAAAMLRAKPDMRLLAETGGKNATIVTALSDRDQAIKNVLHSAFSHSGQKCSATSLLVLESEVYHDRRFRETFCDAVASLSVGSAWELPTKIGPLIRPPTGVLERGLKDLEPGEEWAVMPRLHVDGNPHLVAPGVKWGVTPGGFTHQTELFGPVLGVMEARDLDEAIDLVNATGYGLTSGLESLDAREHDQWQEQLRAGNLYINRPTTGAIVLRQPFGGFAKSAVGPGIKAGGPNYVAPLMELADRPEGRAPSRHSPPESISKRKRAPAGGSAWIDDIRQLGAALSELGFSELAGSGDAARIAAALDDYIHWAQEEFRASHDNFRLLGEDNFRRYLPLDAVRLRVHPSDTLADVACRAAAARAAGCRATVSSPPHLTGAAAAAVDLIDRLTDSWGAAIEFVEENDEQLAQWLQAAGAARLRYAAPDRVPAAIRQAAAESLQYVADAPVLADGRVELLWYVREQSLSRVYHRYGNLGLRAAEPRDEPR